MGRRERAKGQRVERDAVVFFSAIFGSQVRRGYGQDAGTPRARRKDEGVLIPPDVEGTPFFPQVKGHKRCNIGAALRQAVEESDGRPPIALTRNNCEPFILSMPERVAHALLTDWWEMKLAVLYGQRFPVSLGLSSAEAFAKLSPAERIRIVRDVLADIVPKVAPRIAALRSAGLKARAQRKRAKNGPRAQYIAIGMPRLMRDFIGRPHKTTRGSS